ncbi:MAG: hypothetical protein WAK01_10855 [Methylocystis sp.]
MSARKEKPSLPIEVRLNAGNLTIEEVCALASRSKTGFYADLKAGLVAVRKIGRKSVVPGEIAKAYIAGRPLPESEA